jgi:hypothetical protein
MDLTTQPPTNTTANYKPLKLYLNAETMDIIIKTLIKGYGHG